MDQVLGEEPPINLLGRVSGAAFPAALDRVGGHLDAGFALDDHLFLAGLPVHQVTAGGQGVEIDLRPDAGAELVLQPLPQGGDLGLAGPVRLDGCRGLRLGGVDAIDLGVALVGHGAAAVAEEEDFGLEPGVGLGLGAAFDLAGLLEGDGVFDAAGLDAMGDVWGELAAEVQELAVTGQPREDAGFDLGVVGDDEGATGARDEGCAHVGVELVVPGQVLHVEPACASEPPRVGAEVELGVGEGAVRAPPVQQGAERRLGLADAAQIADAADEGDLPCVGVQPFLEVLVVLGRALGDGDALEGQEFPQLDGRAEGGGLGPWDVLLPDLEFHVQRGNALLDVGHVHAHPVPTHLPVEAADPAFRLRPCRGKRLPHPQAVNRILKGVGAILGRGSRELPVHALHAVADGLVPGLPECLLHHPFEAAGVAAEGGEVSRTVELRRVTVAEVAQENVLVK